MPMYTWRHKKTKEVVEVFRSISEADIPPIPDEVGDWEKLLQPVKLTGERNKGKWGRV